MGGSFSISGITLTDSYTVPIQGLGWYPVGGAGPYTSLYAAIEITGLEKAFAKIDHVTVLGASGDDWGKNIGNAIVYGGQLLPEGWTDPVAQIPLLSGTFSMTNSVFNSVASGPWVADVVNAMVTVCDNTITNSPEPMGFYDVSNSKLLFSRNRAASNVLYGDAIYCGQSLFKSGLLPSTVYITDNAFQVSHGAGAVYLQDYGTVSTLNAVVSGNVLQTDTSFGGYVQTDPADYSVIVSQSLKSLVVSHNKILGGGSAGVYVVGGPGEVSGNTILGSYVGVWLGNANGIKVTDNVIKNSAQWGIALTDGSSKNLVASNLVKNSGVFDLYWDGTGSGNVWKANQYTTSNF